MWITFRAKNESRLSAQDLVPHLKRFQDCESLSVKGLFSSINSLPWNAFAEVLNSIQCFEFCLLEFGLLEFYLLDIWAAALGGAHQATVQWLEINLIKSIVRTRYWVRPSKPERSLSPIEFECTIYLLCTEKCFSGDRSTNGLLNGHFSYGIHKSPAKCFQLRVSTESFRHRLAVP